MAELVRLEQTFFDDYSNLAQRFEALQAEFDQRQGSATSNSQLETLRQDYDQAINRCEELERVQEERKTEISRLETEVGRLKADLQATHSKLDGIVRDNQKMGHDIDALRQQRQQLLEENQQLKAKCDQLLSGLGKTREKPGLSGLEKQVTELEAEKQQLIKAKDRCEQKAGKLFKENVILKQQLGFIQK